MVRLEGVEMTVLIVVESMFGNTHEVAEAIAGGMREASAQAEVVDVVDAPSAVPEGVDLLVVGGPTHAFSMTRAGTRADALEKAHAPDASTRSAIGIREWIAAAAPEPAIRVVTFDTRVKVKLIPGSAAKSAAKALNDRGFAHAERGETFWVEDTPGPLKPGEAERARAWGRSLVG